MNQAAWTCLLLAVTVVWGWSCVLVKDAVSSYGVFAFLAVRFLVGAAVLGPFAFRHMTWDSCKTGGLIGLVLAVAYLCQTWGLKYTTATNSGLIVGLFILFVPVVNRFCFGVRTLGIVWAGVALSTAGLFLLTGASLLDGADVAPPNIGDLLSLAAAVLFSFHIALLDRHAREHPALGLAMAQVGCVALVFAATWPAVDPVVWPDPSVWLALGVTGVLSTAFAFYVQTSVQQRIPAVQTAVIITMEPVSATFFGVLLHGDRLATIQWIGAAMMISAVLAVELGNAMRSNHRAP